MKGWQGALVLAFAGVCAGLWLLECDSTQPREPGEVEWVQPLPPEAPGYRLLAHLPDARVALEKEGRTQVFTRRNATFTGPRGLPKWLWVGPTEADIPVENSPVWSKAVPQSGGKAETLCIWAHPAESGKLTLTWPDAPAGILHGLIYFLPAADDKAGVRLRASWNGAKVLDITPATRHGKSHFFQLRLSGDSGTRGELRLEVESRMKGRNHICLDGWVVEGESLEEEAAEPPATKSPAPEAASAAPGSEAGSDTPTDEAPDAGDVLDADEVQP